MAGIWTFYFNSDRGLEKITSNIRNYWFQFFSTTVYLCLLKMSLTCHLPARISYKKTNKKKPFGGQSIPHKIRKRGFFSFFFLFFYAVCCTKPFKKPSALCKEITFLGGEEKEKGRGWSNGTVQWFWIMTCKYVFIQQKKLFDNVLNVSVKKDVHKPLG